MNSLVPSRLIVVFMALGALASHGLAGSLVVRESPAAIPLIQEVDVLVVGGAAGGVEAALAAAKAGARVYLAAPRPYLGDDICATYRLWLEPGEKPLTPLAEKIFQPPPLPEPIRTYTPYEFTYKATRAAAPRHLDPNSTRLTDGLWQEATSQSVEYGEPVDFLVDMGRTQELRQVSLMAFQRQNDFVVGSFLISAGDGSGKWTPVAEQRNELLDVTESGIALRLNCPVDVATRYLKIGVNLGDRAQRMLLGEIVISGEPSTLAPPFPDGPRPVTPMQVKHNLDQALIEANVPFLYPAVAVDTLQDESGRLAGVVIANRSGRQAIAAKVTIDATERAIVARSASAQFRPFPSQTYKFRRIVVDGPPRRGNDLTLIGHTPPLVVFDRKEDAHIFNEYELAIPLAGSGFGAFAAAEQLARDMTWTPDSTDSSETLFHVPSDPVVSQKSDPAPWQGADKVALGALKPKDVENLYILGGCADVSRESAAKLVRPVNLMALGSRLGKEAAAVAMKLRTPQNVTVRQRLGAPSPVGHIQGPAFIGPKRADHQMIPSGANSVPVWADYDVVVVGGGTGGAPAGIGAARQGVRVLVLEYTQMLGGVGTAGLITKYYHGNRVGFTAEVDEGVEALAGKRDTRVSDGGWSPEIKSEWYRRELRESGADIWYGAMGHGAVIDRGRVVGVDVVTPMGRGVVRAKIVIDATGNADIAAMAGADCRYTDGTEVAVQGTGLPPRDLGARYVNTDYMFVDDTDMIDIWRAFVSARNKYKRNYDLGQLVDTRERRQIVGDYTLTPMDIYLKRTFPDTVVISKSNFDSHGYTIHPLFMLRQPTHDSLEAHMPYRCLLPQGVDGILVTGLGVSAHRDSLPIIRMQADIQNQGYAAGVAAAMLARSGKTTRELDVKALQKHLVQIQNLPASVLTDQDPLPLARERFVQASKTVVNNFENLEVLLTDVSLGKAVLRERLAEDTNPSNRLVYAHILGMLGDPAGADTLLETVKKSDWDEGWDFKGGGQFGMSMSPLDSYIIALGRTRDARALPVLIEKAAQLTATSEFSHFRSLALAFETIGDPAAAGSLARLLQLDGRSGRAITNIHAAINQSKSRRDENSIRGLELAELSLARALFRCGDQGGLGEKTLRQYAQSLQGHYARHAQAVLAGTKPQVTGEVR